MNKDFHLRNLRRLFTAAVRFDIDIVDLLCCNVDRLEVDEHVHERYIK